MRKPTLFLSGLVFMLIFQCNVFADSFILVNTEYLWLSSNLTEITYPEMQKSATALEDELPFLGELAYDRYFEKNGYPPPLEFLDPLTKGSNDLAHIEENDIVFGKNGAKRPLKTDDLPPGADKAVPYLLGVPNSEMILVVYPYYLYGCKENDYKVEVYSGTGSHLHTFDSLPAFALKNNSSVLISPEKSGCCDSLRWSVRFYNLNSGMVSNFSCPEGSCGDVLFTRLGKDGPFIVGQEIIGWVEGIGASLQINISIVDMSGGILASGKIIHTIRNPSIRAGDMQEISPYSISKLALINPSADSGRWYLCFDDRKSKIFFELTANVFDSTPAVVFLLSKETNKTDFVAFDGQKVGILPVLGLCRPGEHLLSGEHTKGTSSVRIQANRVNKVFF